MRLNMNSEIMRIRYQMVCERHNLSHVFFTPAFSSMRFHRAPSVVGCGRGGHEAVPQQRPPGAIEAREEHGCDVSAEQRERRAPAALQSRDLKTHGSRASD